jgi:ABC-type Zn uptake system ZnuABC Zn-binding protein ZnuA
MAKEKLKKTGKDYRKELSDLDGKRRSLNAKVNARLLELVTKYPDVELPTSRAGGLKANEIAHPWIIDELKLDYAIQYIETIEKYLADLHPHKQTTITF